MSATKYKIDLWLYISDPVNARKFIEEYDWNLPVEYRPDKVFLESNRIIYFKTMSDEDAVVAAMAILRDVEVPLIMKTKSFEMWEH